jgi:xylan 1,4-beta-xylosidase
MMTIETHGDVLADYDKMGAPVYFGQEQLRQLRDVERLEAPLAEPPYGGPFTLEVPAQGLAVVVVRR